MPKTPAVAIAKTHSGNFTQGQTGATYTITVSNTGSALAPGPFAVSDTVPTGLTATSIGGTGWTCTQPAGPCTRIDFLLDGASFPAITLTVNVAANAPGTLTNSAALTSSSGSPAVNDPTIVNASGAPDLTVTKTHVGNFIQGQTGATYTITVTNSGTAATSGTVTVSDTVPAGLTATAISGTGWTCTQPSGPARAATLWGRLRVIRLSR